MEKQFVKLIKLGKEKEHAAKLPKGGKATLNSGIQVKQSVKLIKPGKEKEHIDKLPKVEKAMLNSGTNE